MQRSLSLLALVLLVLMVHSAVAQKGDEKHSSSSSSSSSTGRSSSSSSSSSSSTGAHVVGDPQFAGLRGQHFQVHGIDGGVYNLISDSHLQLNSQFVFLTGPRPCPILPSTGKNSAACFHHDGSYLGNLALRTHQDDQLLIVAGCAEAGFEHVMLNDRVLQVGEKAVLRFADNSTGWVHVQSTHELTIVASLYELSIDNSDGFVNIQSLVVRGSQWAALLHEAPHGLLGQTWQLHRNRENVIDGVVDDYLVADGDVYGTSYVYNKFALTASAKVLDELFSS